MPLEREIEHSCVVWAEAHGFESIKLDLSARSYPDRLCLGPTRAALFVEFKRPGERPRRRQLAVHRRLASLGWTVHVIDDPEQFRALMRREYSLEPD